MQNDSMEHIWKEFIYPALKSPVTATLIAIIAALGAFLIYFMRRRDAKKDAANIILLELKNAERNLEQARKSYEEGKIKNSMAIQFPEKLRLMSTESWTKYKYLFVRDFEPEQWDEVGKFYENCKYFDEAVELKDSSFNLNETEIRANIHRIVGDYAKELADKTLTNPDQDPEIEKQNEQLLEEYKQKKGRAVDAVLTHLIESYGPDKHFNDAAYYFNLLPQSITNTPTGQRLKKLARRSVVRFK